MQLKPFLLAACLLGLGADIGSAQSLSPMKKNGATPSDIKGFQLKAGNPYNKRMTFVAMVMDPTFTTEVSSARVQPAEFRLAPGAFRTLILQFKIAPPNKERTVAVCVLPKDIEGSILPRVCGTYTGSVFRVSGG